MLLIIAFHLWPGTQGRKHITGWHLELMDATRTPAWARKNGPDGPLWSLPSWPILWFCDSGWAAMAICYYAPLGIQQKFLCFHILKTGMSNSWAMRHYGRKCHWAKVGIWNLWWKFEKENLPGILNEQICFKVFVNSPALAGKCSPLTWLHISNT